MYAIRSYYFGGLFIWNNGIGWYHGSTLEKGNNVEFLNKYCGINTKVEAIRLLLDYAHITPASELHRYEKKIEEKRDMILPEKDKTFNNMYAYLMKKRCIDKEVVYALQAQKKIYQDSRRNCVFVAYDNDGKAQYASMRGTLTPSTLAEFTITSRNNFV